MISTASLTTAALGSTRCVGCEKRFADTPRPTVDIETAEQQRNRYGGFSGPQGTRAVLRRWHVDCYATFERQAAESRELAAAQNEAAMRAMCADLGLDYDEIKARTEGSAA